MEKYLPIGTVVKLKDADTRIMIVGFYPEIILNNKKVRYDYSACLFPEGVLSSDKSLVFNHDQIDKLYFYGLVDEEQKIFMNRLKELIEEEEKNNIELPNLNNQTEDNSSIETL